MLLLVSGFILLWAGKIKLAKILLGLLVFAVLVLTIFPVATLLQHPLETRFTTNPHIKEPVDGIIMLGGAERASLSNGWWQTELNEHAERFTAFITLARRYPDAKLVFSGGSGTLSEQDYKGADVAVRFFVEQGLDIGRIQFERESRNTYENVLYSKKMVKPKPGENWLLVTSADHMSRAVGIFCKLDWPVVPYPVDHQVPSEPDFDLEWEFSDHLEALRNVIFEYVGLVVYYLTGKTDRLLPKTC